MTKNIIVIGAGGHASVIIDIIECMIKEGSDIRIEGLLDDKENLKEFKGYKVFDKISNAKLYADDNVEFIIAIGNNEVRKKIAQNIKELRFFKAIHPCSIIANDAKIEDGTVVMAGTIINSGTSIGKHTIINSGAIVEHDNNIGDFTHISPGATLCGGVNIGSQTHIGANATIIQGIKIGSQTIVGAGSTVIRNIGDNVVVVGTPARIIKSI